MKKEILFVLFLVFAIFLFSKFYITGFTTLKINENTELGGKNIIVKQISSNSIIVDVSGVSDIINEGSNKAINGVKITVEEIFFVDEKEGRFVKLSLELTNEKVCGNRKCEDEETKENCCKDCGCNSDYICENNKCILESKSSEKDECKENNDCDDDNELTIDKCVGTPKKCVYITYYPCKVNEDCNDKNECTKDECINYECFNTKMDGCKSEIKEEIEKVKITEEEKGFLSKLFNKLFG